jgi:hypothetical protein
MGAELRALPVRNRAKRLLLMSLPMYARAIVYGEVGIFSGELILMWQAAISWISGKESSWKATYSWLCGKRERKCCMFSGCCQFACRQIEGK